MAETFAGIASSVLSAANLIRDILLKNRDVIEREVTANIVPLNDEFLKIHQGYVRMFNLLANDVRAIEGRVESEGINQKTVDSLLETSVKEFRIARDDIEGIRDLFRDKVSALIKTCRTDDVQRYLTSLVAYVVSAEDEIGSKEENHITHLKDAFCRRGGDGINTPSIALLNRISDESDPSKVLAIIQEALAGLSLKESAVLHAYFRLRVRRL